MSSEVELRMSLGPGVDMVVGYDSVMKEILDGLMRDTGGTLDDVFRMALATYRLCVDAKRAGKAVGVAGSADDLEQEFTGFRWVTTDRGT